MVNKKKNFKIIAATSMTIFTLFTFFCASMAWFMAVKSVDNAGDGIVIKQASSVVNSIEIHTLKDDNVAYVYNENASITYNVSNTSVTHDSTSNIGIGSYSQLKPAQSILLIFNLNTNAENFKISLSATTTLTLENSLVYTVSGEAQNKVEVDKSYSLSTIIQFKPIFFTDDTVSYDLTSASFTGTYAFVTLTNSTASLTSSLTILNTTDSHSCFGLVMEYSTDIIEFIYSLNLGNDVVESSSEENPIKFDTIDFTLAI